MWWNRRQAPEKTRREQLLEGRDKLQRQLETLQTMANPRINPKNIPTSIPAQIAELSAILAEIENELADGQVEERVLSKRL